MCGFIGQLYLRNISNDIEKILTAPKIAYQSPEARVFFKNSKIKDTFSSVVDKQNKIYEIYNYDKAEKLINKLSLSKSDARLGFRENMSCVMLL
jgi:hypothetical protein